MAVIDHPQERAWAAGEAATVTLMGTINLTIDGNPEAGTLRFNDARGRPIEPPHPGPPRQLRLDEPSPFTPPFGERLDSRWFGWN